MDCDVEEDSTHVFAAVFTDFDANISSRSAKAFAANVLAVQEQICLNGVAEDRHMLEGPQSSSSASQSAGMASSSSIQQGHKRPLEVKTTNRDTKLVKNSPSVPVPRSSESQKPVRSS